MGRQKKYRTAAQLREAVEAYFRSLRYEVAVVVDEAAQEVDKDGNVQYISKALEDAQGRRRMQTKYISPPSVAGLLLFLGIGKATWSGYRADPQMAQVVEHWDLAYEAYLVDQLERGRHISGVIFNLAHNYGWKHRQEQTGETSVRIVLEGDAEELAR